MRSSAQIREKFQQKIKNKNIAARDLTWVLLESIGRDLQLPLTNIDANFNWDNAEKFKTLRENHKNNPQRVVDAFTECIQNYSDQPGLFNKNIYLKLSNLFVQINSSLKNDKQNNEALKIESNLVEVIINLYHVLHEMIRILITDIDSATIINSLKIGLECISFLRDSCMIVEGESKQYYNLNFYEEFRVIYVSLARMYIMQNDYVNANIYLKLYKKLQDKFETNETKKIEYLLEFYLDKNFIALEGKDYAAARDSFFKARSQLDLLFDQNIGLDKGIIRKFLSFIEYLSHSKAHQETLFYLNEIQELLEQHDSMQRRNQVSCGNQYIDTKTYSLVVSKKILEIEMEYFRENYLFIVNKTEGFLEFSVDYTLDLKQGVIYVKENSKILSDFENLLQAHNIVYQMSSTGIEIADVNISDLLLLRNIIDNWINAVKSDLENTQEEEKDDNQQAQVESIAEDKQELATDNNNTTTIINNNDNNNNNTSTTAIPPTTSISSNTLAGLANRQASAQIKAVALKPVKVIEFDADHVYRSSQKDGMIKKLYSPYSKRNYVYVNPELLEYLKISNQNAYQDLLNTCESGRVLGNSKGKKGFIIKGAPFPGQNPVTSQHDNNNVSADKKIPSNKKNNKNNKISKKKNQKNVTLSKTPMLYLKVKNCSKDFRAYGHAEKTKEINGKRYTLFVVDSFSPSHKKKAEPIIKLGKK